MVTHSILIVDDEPSIIFAIKRLFINEPITVYGASGGPEGLDILNVHPIKVVISDEMMPGMSGAEFLSSVRRHFPDIIRIMFTGNASIDSAVRAINEGEIYRFFIKPWDDMDFLFSVRSAIEKYDLEERLTRELVERRRNEVELRKAKEAAEAANRTKSKFLANISHEIRTPMNAILGYVQLMQRDPALTPTHNEYLNIINRSGEHLLALINDILGISRIEAGRVELHAATFDLHTLLDDINAMFRVRTDAKGLGLTVEKIGEVPSMVLADKGKLRQVLINILGNAVKFTEQGGISVHVQAEQGSSGTIRVIIEVEDTGIGIAPEEIDRVFDQFEQAESGRSKGGGAGIGLPISRRYARLMGGDLTVVQSEVGRGSVFRLEFNAESDGSAEEAALPATPDLVQNIATWEKPQRIHLNSVALSVFSGELRTAMREALEIGDMERLLELIDQVAHHAPAVADSLRRLAERYEYDALLKLLRGDGNNA
jgi:signal transduction histidine kinase